MTDTTTRDHQRSVLESKKRSLQEIGQSTFVALGSNPSLAPCMREIQREMDEVTREIEDLPPRGDTTSEQKPMSVGRLLVLITLIMFATIIPVFFAFGAGIAVLVLFFMFYPIVFLTGLMD